MQNQVTQQVAQATMPLALQQYNLERANQLGIAQRAPTLTQVGAGLENIQRQQNLAPFAALQQYGGMVSPIAAGFPTQSGQVQTQANPFTTAMGGAIMGSAIPGYRTSDWRRNWIIRRTIIMEKIKEVWALAKAHPKIATAAVVVVIAIYFLVN